MKDLTASKILQIFKAHQRFLIATHVNPDPDALCSQLALAEYLKQLGKTVHVVGEEKVPQRFLFLPSARTVKAVTSKTHLDYDVALVLDCGELDRIGKVAALIQKDKILINIDHHITNDFFGQVNLVASKSSSTCEIIYTLLKKAGVRLTKSMALHLYAGIMTDTGSFRYENTSPTTHAIAGELLKSGFSAYDLYRRFYESIPLNDVRHFAKILSGIAQSGSVAIFRRI